MIKRTSILLSIGIFVCGAYSIGLEAGYAASQKARLENMKEEFRVWDDKRNVAAHQHYLNIIRAAHDIHPEKVTDAVLESEENMVKAINGARARLKKSQHFAGH